MLGQHMILVGTYQSVGANVPKHNWYLTELFLASCLSYLLNKGFMPRCQTVNSKKTRLPNKFRYPPWTKQNFGTIAAGLHFNGIDCTIPRISTYNGTGQAMDSFILTYASIKGSMDKHTFFLAFKNVLQSLWVSVAKIKLWFINLYVLGIQYLLREGPENN